MILGRHGLLGGDEGDDLFSVGAVGSVDGGATAKTDLGDVGVLREQLFGNIANRDLFCLVFVKRSGEFVDAVVQGFDLLVGMLQEAFHHLRFGDVLPHAGGVFVENDLASCDAIFFGVFIEFFLGFVGQGLPSEEEL